MRLPIAIVVPLLALAGCSCSRTTTVSTSSSSDAAVALTRLGPHGVVREIETLPLCPEGEGDFLKRAQQFYDEARYPDALACAAQAAGAEPANPDAHAERGWTLVAAGKLSDARTAYARALALDPDHRDALQGAAELYITRLPFEREFAELGLAYAERGRTVSLRQKDAEQAGRFASLGATALNDLGRASEAEQRAEEALAAGVEVETARYEKASALWELCRFAEARAEFAKLVEVPERASHAHHYLGLLAERDHDSATAGRELAEARKQDPEAFPPEVEIGAEEFAKLMEAKLAGLPQDMRHDLEGVPVTTQDLPDFDDLIAPDPPLSPTIVGLFRGPSLGEPCSGDESPCRAIVLYRKNMARTVKDRAELERQVEVTLLHELGHLRGEDDTQLVARGLE